MRGAGAVLLAVNGAVYFPENEENHAADRLNAPRQSTQPRADKRKPLLFTGSQRAERPTSRPYCAGYKFTLPHETNAHRGTGTHENARGIMWLLHKAQAPQPAGIAGVRYGMRAAYSAKVFFSAVMERERLCARYSRRALYVNKC